MNMLQEKIANQKNKIEQFIDDMRAALSKTADATEKANRLEVFDTLLLLATYAEVDELEDEFHNSLPANRTDATLDYLRQQLREINGFCKSSFHDNHKVYQELYSSVPLPTEEKKEAIRKSLSETISTLIFDKTNTCINSIESKGPETSFRP